MSERPIHRISGHIVLGLSLFAMCLVGGATILTLLGQISPSTDGDEGTAAHLFQLAIVLLCPAGLTFLATADWRQPRRIAERLVVPVVALLVAFSMLYYMEHTHEARSGPQAPEARTRAG
jgi:amino acid permease